MKLEARILSDTELEEIHKSTLELLNTTGVEVNEEEALSLLERFGVEIEDKRVRIPSEMVEEALDLTPSKIQVFNQDGQEAMELTDYNTYFGTGSDTEYIIDPETNERRPPVKSDVANFSKIAERLTNIDFIMSMGNPKDVSREVADVHNFQAMLENTNKPIAFTSWNLANLKSIVKMARTIKGGEENLKNEPFLLHYSEPSPPLRHSREAVQKLLYMANEKLPIVYTPTVMQGATGPITIAGSLVQENAELLSGLVIAQLKNKGAPFIFGGGNAAMDMNSAIGCYTAPESMMGVAALSDLAHYYNLPLWTYAGCSDSQIFDEQAAAESAYSLLLATLHGGNLIHDVGYLGTGLTSSYQMLVFGDEIIGVIKRIAEGIKVNSETIALDVIRSVGPGGDYFVEDQTMNHFKENWFPDLVSREFFDSWEEKGGKSMSERLQERVLELLEPTSSAEFKKSEEMKAIVSEAEKSL